MVSDFGCPKIVLAIVVDKRIILPRGHSCTDPQRDRRLGAVTFVGSLLHADAHPPDNERWEKAHVFEIEAEHGAWRHLVRAGP